MTELTWNCSAFKDLRAEKLYEILRLRAEIFIVEQNCAYLDPDGDDQIAWHVLGTGEEKLLAYTRLLPPGVKYDSCSIGRVVTHESIRRGGYGRELMEKSMSYCQELWPNQDVTISAQEYLKRFYHSLGFETESESYLEDGIPHVRMRYAK